VTPDPGVAPSAPERGRDRTVIHLHVVVDRVSAPRAAHIHSTTASPVPPPSGGDALATATATSKKLRPLGDRVVIQPSAREEMTKSGIVIPDTAKEKPQEGTIIAAGPGKILEDGKREPMDVKVGDRVLYQKYAGTEFKVDGEELLIIDQKSILAVVED
jgi:chaperonin GroES